VQALYLLAIFCTFYSGIDEARKVRRNHKRYIDLVRKAGLFQPLSDEPQACQRWETWVHEEKRKRLSSKHLTDYRIAFLMYLLDCGISLFFGDAPQIAPWELQHSMPAHEHIFEAPNEFEWQMVFTPTSDLKYPILLEMLLSPSVKQIPPDISVMGHFMLIHGSSLL
jgi:hypothetical protein